MLEKNKVYNLSEFCKVLRESQQAKQEFKAKKGETVDSEDKKNNGKAVEDILKKTKEYDGGIQDNPKREDPQDTDTEYTRGDMLHLRYRFKPNEKHSADVEAQVGGFASAVNKENSKIKEENKGLDFEGNKEYFEDSKDDFEKMAKRNYAERASGLKTREKVKINKETEEVLKDKGIFKENKMKRLHFNKTVFLNEEHMIKKIPDDMKVDGNKFYMKDSIGNEYLIECVKDKVIDDVIHTKVVDYTNKEKLDETFKRMKELYGYKSSNNEQNSGKFENKMVGKMLSESKDKLITKTEDSKDRFFKTLVGKQD